MPRPAGSDVYGGPLGQTRTEVIHFSCACGVMYTAHAHRAVNVTRDPALGARVREGTLQLATCPACGSASRVELPLVYHDEDNRQLVLVLPEALRHRELEERAALYTALAAERGHAIPGYVRDFATVFGEKGLYAHLEARAGAELGAAEAAARLADLATREAAAQRREEELASRSAEMDRIAEDVERRQSELKFMPGPGSAPASLKPPILARSEDQETGPYERLGEDEFAEVTAGGATPRHDSNATRIAPPGRDVAVERWIVTRQPTLALVEQGKVRLMATLPPDRLEAFLQADLQVRIQLHRTPAYPLCVLSVVPASDGVEPLAFFFDAQRVDDRSILGALAMVFQVSVDLYDGEYLPVVQRNVTAPLEENVRAIIASAEEHLASLPGAQRSFEAALAVWRAPGFDRYGRRAHNLEEDSFALLPTPATARLALSIVSYWCEPENEDYLILCRSFPLGWWSRIRSRVVARAAEFGLALPATLSQVALADGLARTRKELAHRLVHAFGDVAAGLKPNDLEPDQVQENWRALVAECEALGVALEGKAGDLAAVAVGALPPASSDLGARLRAPRAPSSPPVAAADNGAGPSAAAKAALGAAVRRTATPVIAGEIGAGRAAPVAARRNLRQAPVPELLALLDDKDLRRDAAMELCRRGEAGAVGPVFGAVRRMTRGEAVRVLPAVVGFGERAVPHLIDGLRSRKAFLRHGCALALGVLKSADGIEPLCDLLLSEPTDVWREIARALGEIGAGAVMSLAARLRDQTPELRERIAWALAHVSSHGGRGPVETMAAGRDAVAVAAAQQALELAGQARTNDDEVRGGGTPRDQTVNRAFSRRFFEAIAGRAPLQAAAAELRGGAGDDAVPLDDAEILDEDEELLDDEDLIPG